jgi:cysteine-rich repeat protein
LELNYTNLANITQGRRYFYLNAQGYKNNSGNLTLINYSGGSTTLLNHSTSLLFLCYDVADGYAAWGCLNDDPDTVACGNGYVNNKLGVANETCDDGNLIDGDGCSSLCQVEPSTTTIPPTSSPRGGRPSSSNLYEKSEATYELLAGDEQQFILPIQNKLSAEKRNISIKVSGINSQYISISPMTIDRIAPNSVRNLTIKITAPSYFTQGKYLLRFDLTGEIRGNTTANFVETKYVTLYLVEIRRTEVDNLLNQSLSFLEEMNNSGLKITQIEEYLAQMKSDYSKVDFSNFKEVYQDLKKIYDSAIESQKLIAELNASIVDAERRGINVDETKRLFLAAETIFERGDYVLALTKLQETKLSYALQVKGEFNLLYEVKNNPVQSLLIVVGVSLFGLGTSLLVRYQLLKAKIRLLKEEQILLLQLMKVVQADCFDRNKMSMEEYNESMNQYEKRLSEVIQQIIRAETQMFNLLKIKGKILSLQQEKERIIGMIKALQIDYMQKGKIETRIYENMLKSYTSRLAEVEEEIVFIETKDALKKNK